VSIEEAIGLAVLIIVVPLLINDALDFFIPGRWEKRAYKRSMEEMKRGRSE
jgi:hypothetical protein